MEIILIVQKKNPVKILGRYCSVVFGKMSCKYCKNEIWRQKVPFPKDPMQEDKYSFYRKKYIFSFYFPYTLISHEQNFYQFFFNNCKNSYHFLETQIHCTHLISMLLNIFILNVLWEGSYYSYTTFILGRVMKSHKANYQI